MLVLLRRAFSYTDRRRDRNSSVPSAPRHQDPERDVEEELWAGQDAGDDEERPHLPGPQPVAVREAGADAGDDLSMPGPDERSRMGHAAEASASTASSTGGSVAISAATRRAAAR